MALSDAWPGPLFHHAVENRCDVLPAHGGGKDPGALLCERPGVCRRPRHGHSGGAALWSPHGQIEGDRRALRSLCDRAQCDAPPGLVAPSHALVRPRHLVEDRGRLSRSRLPALDQYLRRGEERRRGSCQHGALFRREGMARTSSRACGWRSGEPSSGLS
jgi:hypothetical protein